MTSKAAWRTRILRSNWQVSSTLPRWTWPRRACAATCVDDALRPDSQVDICRHFLEVKHGTRQGSTRAYLGTRKGLFQFDVDAAGAWYSSDEGEHWQTISAHLPPVYAVCFATP